MFLKSYLIAKHSILRSSSYHWATEDKESTRVDVENGVIIEILFRDDGLDNKLHNVTTHFFQRDLSQVLGGDDHGVNAKRDAGSIVEKVFASNL